MGDPVVVLGAGLTGLSAALHLTAVPVVVVERADSVGGKARSIRRDGFTFDVTGHWLHLKRPDVRELVQRLLPPGTLVELSRRTTIHTHGAVLPYPFQANLHGLPPAVLAECLAGFVAAWLRTGRRPIDSANIEDYIVRRFGRGMAKHFFIPYYTKYWGFPLHDIASEWHTGYLPVPTLRQVVGGAIGRRQDGLGYNARFLYPVGGGIDVLPEALHRACVAAGRCTVELGTEVEEVDPVRRRVKLSTSPTWRPWRALVSTIPLPELLDRIADLPPPVRRARAALRSIPLRYLDVAARTVSPMREHWVYVPDRDLPFYRVGTFSNAVDAMAPPGCSGLWVELADRFAEPDIPAVLRGLVHVGALTGVDDVLFTQAHEVPHAYVVFDDARPVALDTIRGWLAGHDIHIRGRYGAWAYGSMEDAIVDGIDVAAHLTARVTATSG